MAHVRPLVLNSTRMHVYWEVAAAGPLALRVSDLSGRPPAESLDGTGWRLVAVAEAAGRAYLEELPPGHILWVEVGEVRAEGFVPLATAPPVQLPWTGPVPLPKARVGHVSRS